jgi:hypothetical protein
MIWTWSPGWTEADTWLFSVPEMPWPENEKAANGGPGWLTTNVPAALPKMPVEVCTVTRIEYVPARKFEVGEASDENKCSFEVQA